MRQAIWSIVMGMVLTGLLLAGCTNYSRHRGVENTWRTVNRDAFVAGKTTQMDVAKLLGPPSQVIDLKAGPVFYYLSEQTDGDGVIFIVFNHLNETITYDRAIFFFDQAGVLKDFSFSREALPDGAH